MPRVSKKETPTIPTVPATPTPTVETTDIELGSVVKVKHRKTGKTHEVSRAYYEDNKEKLDVVA